MLMHGSHVELEGFNDRRLHWLDGSRVMSTDLDCHLDQQQRPRGTMWSFRSCIVHNTPSLFNALI